MRLCLASIPELAELSNDGFKVKLRRFPETLSPMASYINFGMRIISFYLIFMNDILGIRQGAGSAPSSAEIPSSAPKTMPCGF